MRKKELYRGVDQLSQKVENINAFKGKLDQREKELSLKEVAIKQRWQGMLLDLLSEDDEKVKKLQKSEKTDNEIDRQEKKEEGNEGAQKKEE